MKQSLKAAKFTLTYNLPSHYMSDNQALQRIEGESFGAMVQRAIDKGVPVETMERLLAMYEKLQERQAKAEFDRALAAFQAECPTIQKTKKVMNKDGRSVRYQYAPLEVIVQQVKALLEKHGFSYTVDAEVEPGLVRATCKATHHLGHSQTSSFCVPIDKDAYMNPAQQCASALTFAKRYAFCNAFGILTGDEDDDSISSHHAPTGTGTAKPPGSALKSEPGVAGQSEISNLKSQISKTATEKTRAWFLAEMRKVFPEKTILQWGVDHTNPTYLLPNQHLEDWPLLLTPTSKAALAAMIEQCARFMNVQPAPQKPSEAAGPPSTSEAPAQSASEANVTPKKAIYGDAPENQPWYRAIVPVPYKGQKRDDYIRKPDTIGELYSLRHDDDGARRRLFGFLHNFEPKGWVKKSGEQMPPSDADIKFRADLDAFGDWFEKNHPEEKTS